MTSHRCPRSNLGVGAHPTGPGHGGVTKSGWVGGGWCSISPRLYFGYTCRCTKYLPLEMYVGTYKYFVPIPTTSSRELSNKNKPSHSAQQQAHRIHDTYTMSSQPTGPISKAWSLWKSLRLPWRKRFFVGKFVSTISPFSLMSLPSPSHSHPTKPNRQRLSALTFPALTFPALVSRLPCLASRLSPRLPTNKTNSHPHRPRPPRQHLLRAPPTARRRRARDRPV